MLNLKHIYLKAELLAGRQVGKLWSVVIDVCDQDADSGGGIETRVALVCHHHLQTVLAVLLTVQRHPVDNFTCTCTEKRQKGEHTWMQREAEYDLEMVLF